MKLIIILIFCILTQSLSGQKLGKNEILDLIEKNTEIKVKKIKSEHIEFKEKPNNSEIVIVFVPIITFSDYENGEESLSQNIFIINQLKGKILTRKTL